MSEALIHLEYVSQNLQKYRPKNYFITHETIVNYRIDTIKNTLRYLTMSHIDDTTIRNYNRESLLSIKYSITFNNPINEFFEDLGDDSDSSSDKLNSQTSASSFEDVPLESSHIPDSDNSEFIRILDQYLNDINTLKNVPVNYGTLFSTCNEYKKELNEQIQTTIKLIHFLQGKEVNFDKNDMLALSNTKFECLPFIIDSFVVKKNMALPQEIMEAIHDQQNHNQQYKK